MSDEKVNTDAAAPEGDSSGKTEKRGTHWDDPNVPVGNAPPIPRWPLVVLGAAWAGWVVFLVVMVMS